MSTYRIEAGNVFYIGDTRFPDAIFTPHQWTSDVLNLTIYTRRAHITLENNWLVSIAWSDGTDSCNRERTDYRTREPKQFIEQPETAEILIYNDFEDICYDIRRNELVPSVYPNGFITTQLALQTIQDIDRIHNLPRPEADYEGEIGIDFEDIPDEDF